MSDLHPATKELLDWFEFGHLSFKLRQVSAPFHALAHQLVAGFPLVSGGELKTIHGAELTVALRKLLEAKDCAVRAALRNGFV